MGNLLEKYFEWKYFREFPKVKIVKIKSLWRHVFIVDNYPIEFQRALVMVEKTKKNKKGWEKWWSKI